MNKGERENEIKTSMEKLAYADAEEAIIIMKAMKASNCTTHFICSADQSRQRLMILCSEMLQQSTTLHCTILGEIIPYVRDYLNKSCTCTCTSNT